MLDWQLCQICYPLEIKLLLLLLLLFVTDLVGKPEDRFSHDAAQSQVSIIVTVFCKINNIDHN